jgi:hypothetical protein
VADIEGALEALLRGDDWGLSFLDLATGRTTAPRQGTRSLGYRRAVSAIFAGVVSSSAYDTTQ